MLCSQIKNIFRTNRPDPQPIIRKKAYQKPAFKELTHEQARLLLIGRASSGDERACDLLYLLFHETNQDAGHSQ